MAVTAAKLLKKHKVIDNDKLFPVSLEKLDSMLEMPNYPKLARYLFASNSRTRAERAHKQLGYQGEAAGLLESLEDDILDPDPALSSGAPALSIPQSDEVRRTVEGSEGEEETECARCRHDQNDAGHGHDPNHWTG